MKLLKLICILLVIASLSSCKVGRFVYYNFADITDHKIFPKNVIKNDSISFIFKKKSISSIPDSLIIRKKGLKQKIAFDDYLTENKTVSFLVIKNDSIEYEKYFSKYDETSIINSFSMAKSVTSILIGCAIDEGLIKSINESITNYLPELKKNGFEKVTINNLLNMTSGIYFNESYLNPFGHAASFYYGKNLRKEITKLRLKHEPGTKFTYSSGDAQLLGLVLKAALKDRSISNYLEQKIWKPLGMEFEASWSLDKRKNGIEKTFCCLNARARDFAKIGRLYLNKGLWNGKRIVSEEWVNSSTKIDETNGGVSYYQNQWWIISDNGTFQAKGILGQRIYVNSKKNLVIVRLGKNDGKTANWTYLFNYLSSIYDE
ncbi:MAG: serine hydrolase [Flavobacteriaceae bacterium]|nr:serine hydrolase [Flavobacteriaceae bacterium]